MLNSVGGGGVGKKNVRRSAAERAAIVAESYEPGATVAGVARRQGMGAFQNNKNMSNQETFGAIGTIKSILDMIKRAKDAKILP